MFMDDYIIDVYHVINPYVNEYEHVERLRFKSVYRMLEHLKHVENKYQTKGKYMDFVITTCKGEESARYVFQKVVENLSRLPDKSEIN